MNRPSLVENDHAVLVILGYPPGLLNGNTDQAGLSLEVGLHDLVLVLFLVGSHHNAIAAVEFALSEGGLDHPGEAGVILTQADDHVVPGDFFQILWHDQGLNT